VPKIENPLKKNCTECNFLGLSRKRLAPRLARSVVCLSSAPTPDWKGGGAVAE